jgi:hypothetical protein
MRPIPFLAALLVLVAMTMPWFTPQNTPSMKALNTMGGENGKDLSLWDVARSLYSNPVVIENATQKTLMMDSPSNLWNFLPVVGVPLIVLGAIVGLFKGRVGHGLGLVGMVLLTLPLVYSPGQGLRGSLTLGIGYILAWVGFSVGLVSSVTSK